MAHRLLLCLIRTILREMLHFMPEGQFYAKQFSAWAGFTPARGGGEVLGEAIANLLAMASPSTSPPKLHGSGKSAHDHFPINFRDRRYRIGHIKKYKSSYPRETSGGSVQSVYSPQFLLGRLSSHFPPTSRRHNFFCSTWASRTDISDVRKAKQRSWPSVPLVYPASDEMPKGCDSVPVLP